MTIQRRKSASASGQRQRKAQLAKLLSARDFDKLRTWAGEDSRVLRGLSSMLFSKEPLACWQAIEGIGYAATAQIKNDPDIIRRHIRNQFWLMNDESGGVGWYAAEAIGEMLHGAPGLIEEFGEMLPSFFKEEPFERGAHWAVARIAEIQPEFYKTSIPVISKSLGFDDPQIRLYAMWAMSRTSKIIAKGSIRTLEDDPAEVSYYDFNAGRMVTSTLAAEAKILLGE